MLRCKKKCNVLKLILGHDYELPTRINITISIQVFNEVLLIGSCLLSKKPITRINIFLNDSLNVVWEKECELPTIDSLMSYSCPRKKEILRCD